MPIGSIERSCEREIVARNIMVILARTGNIFRHLSLEEYITERNKDKIKYNPDEERHYGVVWHTISAEAALIFCKDWNK
jgi:hypothetical protein